MGQGHRVLPLPFGGNYIELERAANRGRDAMPVGFSEFWNAIHNLAWADSPGNDQQNVARSLMLMIQYFSEAARFNEISTSLTNSLTYSGTAHLEGHQLDLENNWARISQFGYDISQNPSTQPREVAGAGTLRSWADVARILVLMLASYWLPGHDGSGGSQA
jgi:hypothetical protein